MMGRARRRPAWRPRQGHCPARGGRTPGQDAGRAGGGQPSPLGPAHRRHLCVPAAETAPGMSPGGEQGVQITSAWPRICFLEMGTRGPW